MFRWPFDTFFNTAISFRTYRRTESRQIRDLHGKISCGAAIVSSRWGDTFTLETPSGGSTHHVFPPLHELLVDDLASIVLAGLDVYGLLHDSVRSAAECLACPILGTHIDRYQPPGLIGMETKRSDLTRDSCGGHCLIFLAMGRLERRRQG